MNKKIAVVIPAYNEEKLITSTINGIPDFIDIIALVDDASSDNTLKQASSIKRSGLNIIAHKKNTGVGGAITTGYRHCLLQQADIVAVMGADMQMKPSELKTVVTPLLQEKADYVQGDRLSFPKAREIMPTTRYLGNHFFSFLTRLCCGYSNIKDSQCGYTAITSEMLKKLNLDNIYPGYGFPNDMLSHLYLARAKIDQVTVTPIYGEEKSGISIYTALFKMPQVIFKSYLRRTKATNKKKTLGTKIANIPDFE